MPEAQITKSLFNQPFPQDINQLFSCFRFDYSRTRKSLLAYIIINYRKGILYHKLSEKVYQTGLGYYRIASQWRSQRAMRPWAKIFCAPANKTANFNVNNRRRSKNITLVLVIFVSFSTLIKQASAGIACVENCCCMGGGR